MSKNETGSVESTNKQLQVLQFVTHGHLFCVDLFKVTQIIDFVALQTVPGAPQYFKGLLDFHGQDIPVVDLGERLGIKCESKYTLETPIVICKDGSKHIGLIIDEIVGVETIEDTDLQMQELLQHGFATFLQGTLKTKKGDSLLLNLDKVCKFDF
jgi:purine-binding chemotaxis protein CheW